MLNKTKQKYTTSNTEMSAGFHHQAPGNTHWCND